MYVQQDGRDAFIFEKDTEVGIPFTIAVYYDPDEHGYCAQLIGPEVEEAWKSIHVGHLFPDGVICLGGSNMRAKASLREAFAKSCLWAEGMAIMIASHLRGEPSEFPFSNNNSPDEVE
jgi:hypothetical protein